MDQTLRHPAGASGRRVTGKIDQAFLAVARQALSRHARSVVTVVPLVAVLLFLGACAPEPPCCDEDPKPLWVVSLGHSESDRAEEAGHLSDFARVLLPDAMEQSATVLAYTAGAHGRTSPRKLSQVDFDTSAVDGDNPVLRARLQGELADQLLNEIAAGVQQVPFSPASDVFGAFDTAKAFFDQFPAGTPKTLISIGDQLANRPTGCVLGARDMSSSASRAALLTVCASAVPNLTDVRVMLVGAGFSLDEPIDAAVAQGLELLLRDYFASAGATVSLYGPVVVAGGSGATGAPR